MLPKIKTKKISENDHEEMTTQVFTYKPTNLRWYKQIRYAASC